MSEPLDTGDDITVDGIIHRIACVHDQHVHLMGNPELVVHVSRCKLMRKATEAQRNGLLQALAGATARGHRNTCADKRLKAMAGGGGGGC